MERKYSLYDILPDFPSIPPPLPTSDELDVLITKQYAEIEELYKNDDYTRKRELSLDLDFFIRKRKMALHMKEVDRKLKAQHGGAPPSGACLR